MTNARIFAAVFAASIIFSGFTSSAAECSNEGWAPDERMDMSITMSELVLISHYAAGDDMVYPDYIRYDLNWDGFCDETDVAIATRAIEDSLVYDSLYKSDMVCEITEEVRLEVCEDYETDKVSFLYGFYPDYVVPYNPDYIWIEMLFSISSGDGTGRIISQPDPCLVYQYTEDDIPEGAVVMTLRLYDPDGDIYCLGNYLWF